MTDNHHNRIELPIVTHWSHAKQGFSYMATDIPEIGGVVKAPFKPGNCYYEYNWNFLPDFNHYLADKYAQTAISDEQAREFITSLREKTGMGVELLRPDAFVSKHKGSGR
jgi:hypothetical protein